RAIPYVHGLRALWNSDLQPHWLLRECWLRANRCRHIGVVSDNSTDHSLKVCHGGHLHTTDRGDASNSGTACNGERLFNWLHVVIQCVKILSVSSSTISDLAKITLVGS